MDGDKCICFGCPNHRPQGQFVGDLCYPCYMMITTGEIGQTESFLKIIPLSQIRKIKIYLIRCSEWSALGYDHYVRGPYATRELAEVRASSMAPASSIQERNAELLPDGRVLVGGLICDKLHSAPERFDRLDW